MTKLSNAQQAAMWAVTHIEAGADAFAPIGRATANTLAARGLFQSGTLQLTSAGRDWIDEQIEAAHADAANEDYERGIAQDATWRDRHRSCCGAGVIVDLEARVEHDHADALKLNVSHVARAIVELIGDNEPFAKDAATVKVVITGHLAADIRTYRITGGQWTEVRVLDNCAYGCKLHGRRVDGFVEYALIHNATYGCPLGRCEGTAQVPVVVDGVVVRSVAEHRCQWNMPTDEEPDSEQCTDTATDGELLCQTHADLNADLMDAYRDSFAGYQN